MERQETRHKGSEEISEFHFLFRPFVQRIFRGALILTGSYKSAEKLQTEIYLKAFLAFMQAGSIVNFEDWLTEIDCFTRHRLRTIDGPNREPLESDRLPRRWINDTKRHNQGAGHLLEKSLGIEEDL